MSDTVILDGELSLTNQLDGQGGTYSRYDWRGYSAYEVAVQEGFVGTKAEWLASLQGATGPQGIQGIQGIQGQKGDPGDDYILTEQDKQEIAGMVDTPVNDVQINGTSIVTDGVANVPIAAIDTSLSTSGAAADAAAVGQALSTIERAIPEIDTTLRVAGKAADGKATGDALDALKEDLNAVIDGSSELASFDSVPTVNATYYTNKVRNWGTVTSRVIPTKTLVYPFDVVLTASDDYSFGVHDLHQAYEFSGDQSASGTQLTDGFVTTFTVPKNTNFLIVLAKGSSHNLDITPEDFHVAMTADTTQPDLTKLARSVGEMGAVLSNAKVEADKVPIIFDSSALFSDFANTPTYNATYYSGAVKGWGTATTRVMNTTTLSYPVPVKLSCADGYVITVDELESPQTFTANKSVRSLRTSGNVTEFVCSANSNILVVIKSSNAIDPSVWADVMSIEMYPYDLTELSQTVDSLVQPSTYHVDGAMIDVTHQGFSAQRIFNPPASQITTNAALQATAYFGGVIFQMYADGSVNLIDFETGDIINSLALVAGHGGSASFSSEYYDATDEFPLLYVSDHETRITRAYRVTRTDFTLVKTYEIPSTDGGYMQATCADKNDNTLWCIGSSVNSSVTGEYFYVSHWNLSDATESNGIYTPVLISKHQLPWKKYMQYVQYLNGQLFVGFGARDVSQPAEVTDTVIWVIDCGTGMLKCVMSEFPQHIIDAEIEGCDFIPNGNKYRMLVSTRASESYHVLTF